jgi:leucyl aminopeptidase
MLKYVTWVIISIVLVSNSLFAGMPQPTQQLKTPQYLAAQSNIKPLVLAEKSKDIYEIKHQKAVNTAIQEIIGDNIWQTLNHLTSYPNRSATKDTGVDAANWLKSTFETMALENGRTDTKTFFVKTGWYKQPSLVTVIGKDLKGPGIVISAHMDTLDGQMPGADEGSGAATIMETARVLLASKTQLKRPIYIIWYAAGNNDLAGYQYVVEYFEEHSIPIKAAIQLDKTGFRAKTEDSTIWLYSDSTDKSLNEYMAKLIKTYIHVPVNYSSDNYGYKDHALWKEDAVPNAFLSESNVKDLNPYLKSSSDIMDLLNVEHMTHFSQLAVAFAIELASE